MLVERTVGKCDRQHPELVCCVHAKAGAKGLVVFSLWYFLHLISEAKLVCRKLDF